MSQVGQVTPKDLAEGYPVTNLTLVVLLLIPCVVILLLLNCLFLGYKLLILSRRSRRLEPGDAEEMLLQSNLQRVGRPDDGFVPLQEPRRAYLSLSEPVLAPPVTSSRASSRERVVVDPRFRLLRPDGATGSGSLRAPSTIRATSSAARFSPRPGLASCSRTCSTGPAARCRGAPAFPPSSGSESEVRPNLVPPNSPEGPAGGAPAPPRYQMLPDVNPAVHIERGSPDPPSGASGTPPSAVGPGLDSDFGASAGVSLRILSADSDGLSHGVPSSALEWDYYDPSYVQQNQVPKHKQPRAAVHAKQYWV